MPVPRAATPQNLWFFLLALKYRIKLWLHITLLITSLTRRTITLIEIDRWSVATSLPSLLDLTYHQARVQIADSTISESPKRRSSYHPYHHRLFLNRLHQGETETITKPECSITLSLRENPVPLLFDYVLNFQAIRCQWVVEPILYILLSLIHHFGRLTPTAVWPLKQIMVISAALVYFDKVATARVLPFETPPTEAD